jgi:DHA1 family bicyclomycin/chloramphenicol resistance-like MFS transporter
MTALRDRISPDTHRVRLILLLGTLTTLSPLTTDLYLPAFPAVGRDLHAGAPAVQLTLTAYLVGVAVGQLVAGPISDAVGRRTPMRLGLAAYVATTVLAAVAPSAGTLIAVRFVEGGVAAAGMVVTLAVVRDLFDGVEVSRFLSRLMMITGFVPILAPFVGGQLLRVTDWRGLFWILAAAGALLLAALSAWLPETLTPALRRRGSLGDTVRTYGRLARDRRFVGLALTGALSFGSLLVYISVVPFVFEGEYGLSEQRFGLVFGVNSLCLVGAGQLSGRLVGRRYSPDQLLRVALPIMATGALLLVPVTATRSLGLAGLLLPVWLLLFGLGFVTPNTTALALADHPDAAGTASAFLGSTQFVLGAVLAPVAGAFGGSPGLALALAVSITSLGAVLAYPLLVRRRRADAPA